MNQIRSNHKQNADKYSTNKYTRPTCFKNIYPALILNETLIMFIGAKPQQRTDVKYKVWIWLVLVRNIKKKKKKKKKKTLLIKAVRNQCIHQNLILKGALNTRFKIL